MVDQERLRAMNRAADLAPEVAGAVVAALNRRQFERAEARSGETRRARSQDQGERPF